MSTSTSTATIQRTNQPVRRGYSSFAPNDSGSCSVNGASIHHNVLIKRRLPSRGIVSSNPKRVERLLEKATKAGLLTNVKEHTNSGWGVTIYTCTYHDIDVFVAGVPMGAGGSGFAFFEMFAAGAQAIVRYGSNDRQVNLNNLRELVIVDQADNLVGLPYGSAHTEVTPQTIIPASSDLVNLLSTTIANKDLPARRMICHHVEDYHSYNFHEFFDKDEGIQRQIDNLEQGQKSGRGDCWDMETAALFWRAQQFGLHAATVLQNLYKKPGTTPYEGEHGKISLEMEDIFYLVIFETLSKFRPKDHMHPPDELACPSSSRALRRRASNDFVGVEEPLHKRPKLAPPNSNMRSLFGNLLTPWEVVVVCLIALTLANTLPLLREHWCD